jgi:hypothetical protein
MKIVLDIETFAAPMKEWAALVGINVGQDECDYSSLEKDYQKSIFDGTFSRIVCIGILLLKDDSSALNALAWYGGDEKGILSAFWDFVGKHRPEQVITHNGLNFDLPFIKKRSIIHQVKPSVEINLARFQTRPVFDTMAVWSNWEFRGGVKLDVLARALGVETKSGSGEQVKEMWSSHRWEDVALYCLQDVYVTYACYCRMNYIEPMKSSQALEKVTLQLV